VIALVLFLLLGLLFATQSEDAIRNIQVDVFFLDSRQFRVNSDGRVILLDVHHWQPALALTPFLEAIKYTGVTY
jgi:hypothetical protein